MTDPEPERRQLAALRAAIAQRLRPVCQQWPPDLFDGMVDGLAKITLKYEHADPASVVEPRTTDRTVGDMSHAADRSAKARESER